EVDHVIGPLPVGPDDDVSTLVDVEESGAPAPDVIEGASRLGRPLRGHFGGSAVGRSDSCSHVGKLIVCRRQLGYSAARRLGYSGKKNREDEKPRSRGTHRDNRRTLHT